MNAAQSTWPDKLAVLARWILGALFIYMGAAKAAHPDEFLKLVRQYDLTANYFLLNVVASTLPWFEIFCGLLLLAGIAVRGVALVLAVILIAFTCVVLRRALALESAQAIAFCAVKFDCGCGNGQEYICHKLPENLALILLSLWIVLTRSHRLSLRPSLFKPANRIV